MRWVSLLLLGCLVMGLAGCAGYRVGPTNGLAAGVRSIQVNPFRNETTEPRLLEPVTSALRRTLQQDGTYRLNTSGQGDIIVNGTLVRYEREGVSFQPNDILSVRDFKVRLVARVTALERSTGKMLLDQEVTGQTTLRLGADLGNTERQAVPLLAQDLAQNTVSLLVDGRW